MKLRIKTLSVNQFKKMRYSLFFALVFFVNSSRAINDSASSSNNMSLNGILYYSTARLLSKVNDQLSQLQNYSSTWRDPVALGGVIPVVIRDIQFQLSSEKLTAHYSNRDELTVVARHPQIVISVPEIKINTVIYQQVGGVDLQIKVNTTCSQIQLQMNTDEVTVSGLVKDQTTTNNLSLGVENLKSNLSPVSLSVNEFQCTQINGFEKQIKEAIQIEFSKINFYKLILEKNLNDIINIELGKMSVLIKNSVDLKSKNLLSTINNNEDELSGGQSSKQVTQFKLVQINDKALIVRFNVPTHVEMSKQQLAENIFDLQKMMDATMDFAQQNMNDVVVVVNQSQFFSIAEQIIKLKLMNINLSSKSIPALDKLTRSRFQQFFVFPALMKRPKGNELILHPYLEGLNMKLAQNSFQTQINFQPVVGMWIYDQGLPMTYIRSNLTLNSKISAQDTNIISQILSMKSRSLWSPEYLKTNHVSTRISTSILETVSTSYFNQNFFKQNINLLTLTNELLFKVQDYYSNSQGYLFIRAQEIINL